MALKLKCDKCNKDMGYLEKFVIKNDQYICVKCSEEDYSNPFGMPAAPPSNIILVPCIGLDGSITFEPMDKE